MVSVLEFRSLGLHLQHFWLINIVYKVSDVVLVDDGSSVKYSADTNFFTEKYEILWEHLPILVRVWQVEHKITWSPMIAAAPPPLPPK